MTVAFTKPALAPATRQLEPPWSFDRPPSVQDYPTGGEEPSLDPRWAPETGRWIELREFHSLLPFV